MIFTDCTNGILINPLYEKIERTTSLYSVQDSTIKYEINAGNYNLYYFVEGRLNTESVYASITDVTDERRKYESILTNNENTLSKIKSGFYLLKSDNYYKLIDQALPMIKGYIIGTVNMTNCNINTDIIIKCFRSEDNLFIGEYPLINNTYRIDNLDTNTLYTIIMVDKNRVVEQRVSSYRSPLPYI